MSSNRGHTKRRSSKAGASRNSRNATERNTERNSERNSDNFNQKETYASEKLQRDVPIARRTPAASRCREVIPLILRTEADDDYALLDSGNGKKLERYGPYIIQRPEAEAIWQPALDKNSWNKAVALFTGDTDEDGIGRWMFPHEPLGETWPMEWDGISFIGRFTSFRHVGVFPEQAAHWHFMEQALNKASKLKKSQPKILNLFGYTGIASLVAARAGAHVTHVDASKKAIGWAIENQEQAAMTQLPIRWICDDAVKFCEREVRRGNKYDGILLDPPKYGRGPKGEIWRLFEDLPHLVDLTRELISSDALFVVLTSYSIRSSFYAMHELMQEVYGDMGGTIESGELILCTEHQKRALSTSLYSRWINRD